MQIKHPHLAQVLDVTSSRECDVIAMEYVSGPSLARIVKKKKRISEKRAVQIVLHLADALSACHAAGLVHRNIHPDNILVTPGGKAKLISFGFSKPQEFDAHNERPTTEMKIARYLARSNFAGRIRGTPVPTSTRSAPCCTHW